VLRTDGRGYSEKWRIHGDAAQFKAELLLTLLLRLMSRPDSPNKHKSGLSDLNVLYSPLYREIGDNFSLFH